MTRESHLESTLQAIAREFEKPSKSLSDFGVSEHYKWIAYSLRKTAADAISATASDTRAVPISLLRQLNKLSGYVHENEIRQIIGEHEK